MRNGFVLLASLFFYAWGEPWFVFIMIISILANWFLALMIDRYRLSKTAAKYFLILSITINIGLFFIFKYLAFTISNLNYLFDQHFYVPNIILPIGISFFTFQALSYVIDVYRTSSTPSKDGGGGQYLTAQRNPLNVGLYISLFPQLIAGPIVRYSTIAEQISGRHETMEDFTYGIHRFIIGLFKKAVIANTIAISADQIFSLPAEQLTVATAWLGALAFTFQIYFDFSGYSDMAIGLGRMFGFRFLENFHYPYISKSVSEFWRRWHISLGSWFRDYVYFPLGGSRVKSKPRLCFNLLFVWLLTGLWHGAAWNFILWGLMFFVFICFEKLTGLEKYGNNYAGNALKWLYTFMIAVLGWVLFRSENLTQATAFYQVMFGLSSAAIFDKYTVFYSENNLWVFLLAILASTPLFSAAARYFFSKIPYQYLYAPVMLLIWTAALCFMVHSTYNPFIYFNF